MYTDLELHFEDKFHTALMTAFRLPLWLNFEQTDSFLTIGKVPKYQALVIITTLQTENRLKKNLALSLVVVVSTVLFLYYYCIILELSFDVTENRKVLGHYLVYRHSVKDRYSIIFPRKHFWKLD